MYLFFWNYDLMNFSNHIGIIGSGISGLTLAYALKKNGIEVRSGFWPLNSLKSFNSVYVTNKNITQKIFNKIIILPSSYDLKNNDIRYIIKKVIEFQKR